MGRRTPTIIRNAPAWAPLESQERSWNRVALYWGERSAAPKRCKIGRIQVGGPDGSLPRPKCRPGLPLQTGKVPVSKMKFLGRQIAEAGKQAISRERGGP